MIDVYICEDNVKQLNTIKKYVQDAIMIEELDMNIALATGDPHAVLEKLQGAGADQKQDSRVSAECNGKIPFFLQ